MYGSTVESLFVYVRSNGSEERIWSRYGNHLSSNWTKGCVAVNINGTYQVQTPSGLNSVVISLIKWLKTKMMLVYVKHLRT